MRPAARGFCTTAESALPCRVRVMKACRAKATPTAVARMAICSGDTDTPPTEKARSETGSTRLRGSLPEVNMTECSRISPTATVDMSQPFETRAHEGTHHEALDDHAPERAQGEGGDDGEADGQPKRADSR